MDWKCINTKESSVILLHKSNISYLAQTSFCHFSNFFFSEINKEFYFRLLSLSIFFWTLLYTFITVLNGVQLNAVMIFTAVGKGKVIQLQAHCGPEAG